jgi:3-hydroxyisobutyrate dehydrogenase
MPFTKAAPEETRVGWIGTGVMGRWMCQHVISKGYKATVYNRSREKAQPLAELGAVVADSPKAVAERSDVVFAIVGFPKDVRDVFLGSNGALAASKAGTILVDMTTSEPSLAREIHAAAKAKGVGAVDAPVSGGDVGAKNAALSIMVGGDADAVEAVRPLFECMGKTIIHQGGPGAGQHTKMVNQILIATNMIGVCEALLYAYKSGLDPTTVLQSVGGGAAASWSLNNLGPRIIARNFEPGFFVEHFIKDMGIALDEARRMGLCLPGLALANQLYLAVQAQGYGRKGTHALMLALERLSNFTPATR